MRLFCRSWLTTNKQRLEETRKNSCSCTEGIKNAQTLLFWPSLALQPCHLFGWHDLILEKWDPKYLTSVTGTTADSRAYKNVLRSIIPSVALGHGGGSSWFQICVGWSLSLSLGVLCCWFLFSLISERGTPPVFTLSAKFEFQMVGECSVILLRGLVIIIPLMELLQDLCLRNMALLAVNFCPITSVIYITHITWDDLKLHWPKWTTSDILKVIYLYAPLERVTHQTKWVGSLL